MDIINTLIGAIDPAKSDLLLHLIINFILGIFVLYYPGKNRKSLFVIFIIMILSQSIDLEHFIIPSGGEYRPKYFHSIYFLISLPLFIFLAGFVLETNKNSSIIQRASLGIIPMNISHLIIDAVSGDTMLIGVPFSYKPYTISNSFQIPLADIQYYNQLIAGALFILIVTIMITLINSKIYNLHESRNLVGGRPQSSSELQVDPFSLKDSTSGIPSVASIMRTEALFTVLKDKRLLYFLAVLSRYPMTVPHAAYLSRLPIRQCYQFVKYLLSLNLIVSTGTVQYRGKLFWTFRVNNERVEVSNECTLHDVRGTFI